MNKFTPRPWHRNIKPASKYPVVYAGRNTHVASVIPDGHDEETVEANIRLISAAPDLLAALMEFIRIDEQSDLLAADGGELVSALHDARAAIAKATGGTGA